MDTGYDIGRRRSMTNSALCSQNPVPLMLSTDPVPGFWVVQADTTELHGHCFRSQSIGVWGGVN